MTAVVVVFVALLYIPIGIRPILPRGTEEGETVRETDV